MSLLLLAFLLPAMAVAQQASVLSAADRAEIQKFTLNDDVFNRLQAVTKEGRAMHIKKYRLDMTKVHSLDDMANQVVTADPRIKPLLSKHGFTPHQFLVANMALVGTVMTVRYAEQTGQEQKLEAQLNPANVSFYKSHKAAVDAMVRPAPASAASAPSK